MTVDGEDEGGLSPARWACAPRIRCRSARLESEGYPTQQADMCIQLYMEDYCAIQSQGASSDLRSQYSIHS
jgi:hypothetical protein